MNTEHILIASALGLTAFGLTAKISPLRWLRLLSNALWALADGLTVGGAATRSTYGRLKGDLK